MSDLEFYMAMEAARRSVCSRFGRGLDDAAAEVDAAYWELIVCGERDPRCLYWAVARRLEKVRCAAARFQRYKVWTAEACWFETADDVVERVHAAQVIEQLAPPGRVVAAFNGRTSGVEVPDCDRQAMRRWMRREEVRDAAAA